MDVLFFGAHACKIAKLHVVSFVFSFELYILAVVVVRAVYTCMKENIAGIMRTSELALYCCGSVWFDLTFAKRFREKYRMTGNFREMAVVLQGRRGRGMQGQIR